MTNCQINCTTHEYLLKVNSTNLTRTSSEVETSQVSTPLSITSTKVSPSKTSKSTSQTQQQPKEHMPEAQLRKIPTSKSPLYDQSSGRGELHTTQKWIPKDTIASQSTPSTSKSPPKPLPSTKSKQLMKQMWVSNGQPLPNTSTSMPM